MPNPVCRTGIRMRPPDGLPSRRCTRMEVHVHARARSLLGERGAGRRATGRLAMAAMKPRTGDGPLEVTKEGRGIVMRVPLEGGGRLVVELNAEEAEALGDALKAVVS